MKPKYTAEQIREARTIIATINVEKANRVLRERYTPEELSAMRSKSATATHARRRENARKAALEGATSAV